MIFLRGGQAEASTLRELDRVIEELRARPGYNAALVDPDRPGRGRSYHNLLVLDPQE